MNWDIVSALAAAVSVAVSVVALHAANSTNNIAIEALKTARQANDISLGVARVPSVVEFAGSDSTFDLTDEKGLKGDLKMVVTVENTGKKPVDALGIEIIGIEGLTYSPSNTETEIHGLPSYSTRIDFTNTMQAGSIAIIDMRSLVLNYLARLIPLLPPGATTYTTVVNMVLEPKAVNEPTPSQAGRGATTNDRRLLTIKFSPSIIQSQEAKSILAAKEVPTRVLGY
ncbi:hypothetical protein [Paraburkholderia tropica]|uniref:hypothetical protein n=1 Tax=Paraburkholderia tropica TaxID=92647 RepID=UPI002AB64177|nr:hypothetical protein [Paraburkholderia tropica]